MKARFHCFLLTFLTHLWLSSNASRCPEECECRTYIEIDSNASTSSYLVTCNARGLTTFPKDIQPNVTHLDLSSNRLSDIPKKIFHNMSSLRELILTDNPIVDIPDGGFNHLTSLQNLCMSETFLEAVPVFTVPSPIVHLHLDKTNINELSPDSLRYYSKLESLHLKGSKIKRLVNGVFRHAPSLKYLRMEYSTLEYIDAGAFDGVQLEKLEEAEFIKESTSQYPNIETGGDLFGLWQSESEAVVQLAIGPGQGCRRTTTSFFQDTSYLSNVGNYLTSAKGLCNFGSWHSHHSLNLPEPSGGDKQTVWGNMPGQGLKRFVVIIARFVHGTPKFNAFMFTFPEAGYRYRKMIKMECRTLEGPNPFRRQHDVLAKLCEGVETMGGELGRPRPYDKKVEITSKKEKATKKEKGGRKKAEKKKEKIERNGENEENSQKEENDEEKSKDDKPNKGDKKKPWYRRSLRISKKKKYDQLKDNPEDFPILRSYTISADHKATTQKMAYV